MVFGNRNGTDGDIELKVYNVQIEGVFETEFLGGVIDHK